MGKGTNGNRRGPSKPKDWRYAGEVDAASRPVNSLVSAREIEYEKTEDIVSLATREESRLLDLLKHRIRERKFDNFEYRIRKEEEQCTSDTGDADENAEVDRGQLEELFLDIKSELDALINVDGVWHNTSIVAYEKRCPRRGGESRADKKAAGRDKESAKVLRNARNVRIVK